MLLRSVPGVGPLTALTYVLTLGDTARFTTSREAGAFLGLRPRQRQSGSRNPELGIAKNGDHTCVASSWSVLTMCSAVVQIQLSSVGDSGWRRLVRQPSAEHSLRSRGSWLCFFIVCGATVSCIVHFQPMPAPSQLESFAALQVEPV